MITNSFVRCLKFLSRVTRVAGVLCFGLYSFHCVAAPMDGYESTFKQPDGTEITLKFYGDEFYARTETVDGYTVVFDPATQSYEYANVASDGKKLLKTGMKVGKGDPQALGVKKHLDVDPAERSAIARNRFKRWDDATGNSKRWAEIKAGMQAADAKASAPQLAPGVESAPAEEGIALAPPSFTTTGNKLGLTLLIDFSDAPATIPQAEIIDFCNGDSYTNYSNNGSVKKYFQDNSKGMLTYSNVVTVYIRMAQPKTYYNVTTNDAGDQANILIKDALDIMKAMPNYNTEILPTFANLTVDGSNRAVAFNVFYAGGNGGVWSFGLWPHSWSLYNVGAQPLGNGKSVFKYQLTNIGTSLELGTFCHENGHMLCGYPDIYDYGYDSVGGAGVFCLMNSGGHGGNPVLVCAYLRRAAGWTTTTDFNASTNFTATLTATVGHADFNKIYRYPNPAAPTTEYFLFENRQKTGRDAGIAASGIAIWHIDQLGNKDNQSRVRNTSHANYECTLIQADNLWHFNNDVNSGDSKDLYYLGNTAAGYINVFSDTTGPDANWWSGALSGLRAANFSASGATMTFELGLAANTVVVMLPNGGESLWRGTTNEIQWAANITGNVKIELYKGGSLDSTISANEANDGSYQWAIPVGQTVGSDYKIKISSVLNSSYSDLSNTNFSIAIQPTLEDALDTTGITWTPSGNLPWFPQSTTSHDSVDAAQSGAISDSQSSSLETTLAGPGTLTFWWKVSSEAGYDYLRFYSNGVEQAGSLAKIAGEVAWVQKTVNLPAGNTTVKWTYSKDSSVASGSDAAWVDQVVWTPATAPEIAVEQPVGTNLVDGSSTINFNSVNMGSSSAPFTFTVKNTGTANLTGLALAKSGTHSNDFTLGSLGSTTVAPGTSTTFTVTFSPSAIGTRTAALQIASNDGNENPFDIALTGTGVGAGITITHSGGSTAVTEGGATDTYTIALSTQPAANVTVTITPNAQVTVSPTNLTFTTVNWATPQTVTVTAVNDLLHEMNHIGTITHTAASADSAYNGISLDGVLASITDNDNSAPVVNAGPDHTVLMTGSVWSPASLSPLAWYDASDTNTITQSAGVVSQWNDKSGRSNHLTQATSTNRPATTGGQINGLTAITFDGTNDTLRTAANPFGATISNAFLITVLNAGAFGASTAFSLSASGTSRWQSHAPWSDGTVYFDCGGASGANRLSYASGWAANKVALMGYYCSVSDNVQEIWEGGTKKASDVTGHAVTTSGPFVFGSQDASDYDNIKFGEVLIINSTITATNRQCLEGYLANKWGLAGTLPTNHPYKVQAPSTISASTNLDATVTEPDSDPVTTLWTVVSGPGPVVFGDATAIDTTVSFTVEGSYTLRLTASDSLLQASDDVLINVTTNQSPPAISAPTGLSANATATNQVKLAWTDASTNETGFAIQRSLTSGSGFSTLGTAAANATNYTDNTVSAATTYYYRVAATNAATSSAYSAEASATTPKLPAAVTLGSLSQAYDGTARTATYTTSPTGLTVTVTYNGIAVAPTNAGSYAVTGTVVSTTYTGSTNGTLTVSQKSVSGLTIAASGPFVYTGAAQTPEPQVSDGATVLVKNTHFTYSYSANTNAGTATVTVNGIGNYTGTKNATFTISPATLTVTPNAGQSKVFGGANPTLTYTNSGAVASETAGFSGALARAAGEAVGTYAITQGTLALANNGAFKTANYTLSFTAGVNFSITGKSVSALTVGNVGPFTYDGTPKTPQPVVSDGAVILTNTVSYTLSYTNNTNAGTGTVIVTGVGNYSGTTNKNFTINPATPTVTAWPTASSIIGGQAFSNSVLSGGSASVAGSFSFLSPATVPQVGVTNAAVVFTPTDSTNYQSVNGSVAVVVIDIYTVPFFEPFEARQLGDLNGQYGWISEGVTVQGTNTFASSSKAAQISGEGGYLKHAFTNERTKVWADMRLKVVYSPEKPKPETNTTVAVYVSTNSMIMAFTGTNVVSTGISAVQGSWVRFTFFSDYVTKTYILFVNDARAGKYGFYSAGVTNFTELKVSGQATFIDNVGVTASQPPMNGMPSLILLQ
jgi:M6 family metalloprotease-like protein